ncbi:MAG: PH domain-containing protein [Hyphomicrobium sp.]
MSQSPPRTFLPLRMQAPEKAAAFGRRPTPAATSRPGPGHGVAQTAAAAAIAAAPPSHGEAALVVRYNWRVGMLGIGLLVLAGKLIAFWWMSAPMGDPSNSLSRNTGTLAYMMDGPGLFLTSGLLLAAIALGWLSRLLTKAPALTIDQRGVTGFTLLGTKHIAWEDISRLEINWHATYRQQLIIHAVWGSRTGGWGVLSPTGIPILASRVDRPLSEILHAIGRYRPDLVIDKTGGRAMVEALTWYKRILGH